MANVPYLLLRDRTKSGGTFTNNVDTMLVAANSTGEAQAIAEAYTGSDPIGSWTAVTPATLPVPDFTGAVFAVTVKTAGGALTTAVSVTGVASTLNTIDLIGAALATALNAAGPMANAAYNASTNVLTVASIADDIGDHLLAVTVTMPTAVPYNPSNIVTATVSGGIAGAVLTATFAADSYVPPAVLFAGSQMPD